jgi:hypothetical protein
MKTATYQLPACIMAEIEALPPSFGGRKREWTKEQDASLSKGWPTANHAAFIKWFIEKHGFGSKTTLQRRYRYLESKTD